MLSAANLVSGNHWEWSRYSRISPLLRQQSELLRRPLTCRSETKDHRIQTRLCHLNMDSYMRTTDACDHHAASLKQLTPKAVVIPHKSNVSPKNHR